MRGFLLYLVVQNKFAAVRTHWYGDLALQIRLKEVHMFNYSWPLATNTLPPSTHKDLPLTYSCTLDFDSEEWKEYPGSRNQI